jgi:type I restriction enzyme S subunit
MLAHLLGRNKGVAIKHLHLVDIRNLRIPLPPLEPQEAFARRTVAAQGLQIPQRAALNDLATLFACLQHRAFRGEL